MSISAADIEAIERATAAAVAPEALEEIDGWLLAFDSGVVGRAKSAAPLRHARCDLAAIGAIEARYAAHRMRPMFRVADVDGLKEFCVALQARDYRRDRPTLVQIADTDTVRGVASADGVEVAKSPDAAWISAFLGEGFDPADGASRAKTLARGADTVFASVREDGVAIGAGAASFGHGWASIHGMRTAKHLRGERIAARVVAALAEIARQRGMQRIFLQVEADNEAAKALYRRAGFATLWPYSYWTQAA